MSEEVKDPSQAAAPEQPSGEATQEQPKSAQESFREARERMNQQESLIAELRNQNQYFMSQLQQNQAQAPKEEEFDVNALPSDLFLETDHLKKVDKKYAQKMKDLERRQVLQDLREEYPDFKKVCSTANLNKLEQESPELARSILMNPDYAEQMKLSYDAIKRWGIYKEQETPKEEDLVAKHNQYKAKPAAAAKSSQSYSLLGQAGAFSGRLTDAQKREVIARAQSIANGE